MVRMARIGMLGWAGFVKFRREKYQDSSQMAGVSSRSYIIDGF